MHSPYDVRLDRKTRRLRILMHPYRGHPPYKPVRIFTDLFCMGLPQVAQGEKEAALPHYLGIRSKH
jgi:hypothetical protein